MIRTFSILLLLSALPLGATRPDSLGFSTEKSLIAPEAYAATSVNTAIFRASSVTSDDVWQYAAFYDPDGRVVLARRLLDAPEWQTHVTRYRGRVADAHNVISIGVDGCHRLHVAFDHHGDSLHYFTTLPSALDELPLRSMTASGEDNVTYPEFYPRADGSLLFVYRDGSSGRGNMVMNTYDPATDSWSRLHDVLIDGEDQRNAYWQLCTDADGTLHLSWVWRDTWMMETNHDLCYARSRDGGLTWERSDSTPYILPITQATAEIACAIPRRSELINQTSMVADEHGHPYIATYWRDADSDIPQYRLVSHDGDCWHAEQVGTLTLPFTLSGGGTKRIPISRPRLVAADGRLFYIFRAEERGSRVSVATRRLSDKAGEWIVTDLTEESVGAWEPTVDNETWRNRHLLDIYVQRSDQGDGEQVTDSPPSPLYLLRLIPAH